ncbi:amino acid permease [Rhizobium sp. CFBP 8762]|uniref:amino acid permease n=1 Tax=Rhizobium sp. CFBP 8762 TaxID=2775279 RepID=UPI00177E72D5|nr:amino acid permease [Rhizobium sp. CFBP 8762]MBD8554037.1 amino acid permease [Rhizobium sp. CFBP 8762]
MTEKTQFQTIADREVGLKRQLTAGQMSMIAIGGAVGTGLFMGSSFAIGYAGPGVLISYGIGALISLLLMGCLAEMTVAHPTSGSFGAYAEYYVGPLAGFLVRYAYWAAVVLAVGTEVTAVAIYMKFWFPTVPGWIWIMSFSAALILVNAFSVKTFGHFEYWFSAIKVSAIIGFLILGAYLVFGSGSPQYGFHNYTVDNGLLPFGLSGVWVAVIIAIFSYLGIEMIAVAAGEAENAEVAVRKAFRATIVRLVIFYLATLTLILAIVPWNQSGKGAQSPFVTVMQDLGIPGASGVINFVILVAALSAMNSQFYTTTRMMFSLSRGGFAPRAMGKLSRNGVPLNALAVSCIGVAFATLVSIVMPDHSFTLMMAISMFGALFTWVMIFYTHLRFRQYHSKHNKTLSFRMWGFPYATLLGLALMVGVLVTTAFTPAFKMTLIFGVPFLLVLMLLYAVYVKRAAVQVSPPQNVPS